MHPGITLYIAGHTDTVGSASTQPQALAGSRALHRRLVPQTRRQAADRLRGFGETSPEVKTADNTDEPKTAASTTSSPRPPHVLSSVQAKLEGDSLTQPPVRARVAAIPAVDTSETYDMPRNRRAPADRVSAASPSRRCAARRNSQPTCTDQNPFSGEVTNSSPNGSTSAFPTSAVEHARAPPACLLCRRSRQQW